MPVLIISGPPGAGKSSAASALVEQYERVVHLATDFFFETSMKRGYILPWLPEAHAQNTAAVTAAARAAGAYAQAGYQVILDGVVLPWALGLYERELAPVGVTPDFVALLPAVTELIRRGLARPDQHGLDAAVYRQLHAQFAAAFPPGDGRLIDTTGLAVAETVAAMLARLGPEWAPRLGELSPPPVVECQNGNRN
jgi:chloramphenicol 3-O-phosphotransferase